MTPKTARRIHLALMVFWAVNLAVVWFLPTSWRISYLVVVSIYANFVGHWGGFSAERPSETVDDAE
jgi:hypothetical protein